MSEFISEEKRFLIGFDGALNNEDSYSLHTMEELMVWLDERKAQQKVSISFISLNQCSPWFYDENSGEIRNENRSFFQVAGMRCNCLNGIDETIEQPIIIQNEIGFLGIICKKISGVWHFLMQAKIEPGNINFVQISPTLQATKSNFTRKHGGKEPAFLTYFKQMKTQDILVDQIQSEQSSRFYGKRNRNVILRVEEDITESENHRWMTLRQLQAFMHYDNLVNMDTRTVLSGFPYIYLTDSLKGYSAGFVRSMKRVIRKDVVELYLRINDYKMFSNANRTLLPVRELKNWSFTEDGIHCKSNYPFDVVFCNVEIEGREVSKWNQPLFRAKGAALFGLICCKDDGIIKVLVQIKPEIGCYDMVELGPTIQREYGEEGIEGEIGIAFDRFLSGNARKLCDVVLSEEGGRFYHEQNRNVIIEIDRKQLEIDRKRFVWVSLGTLNWLMQMNNCLNIQLRNLVMLLSLCCSEDE